MKPRPAQGGPGWPETAAAAPGGTAAVAPS